MSTTGFARQPGVQRYSFRTLLIDPSLECDRLQVPVGGVIVLLAAAALRLRRLEPPAVALGVPFVLCVPAAGGQGVVGVVVLQNLKVNKNRVSFLIMKIIFLS